MRTVAVIVLFNPELDLLLKNVAAVSTQVEHIIIVSNGIYPSAKAVLDGFNSCITYIESETNRGLAWALNAALQLASSKKYVWMLTLDQDSILPNSYVATLKNAARDLAGQHRIASIGSHYLNTRDKQPYGNTRHGGVVKYLITSGNLVAVSALKSVGGFRSDFFVDYIDLDLSFKLRRAGYALYETHDVCFSHNLGAPTWQTMFGVQFHCSNHSALRCYYISRNRLVFWTENFRFDPAFVIKDVWGMFKDVVKMIVGEDNRVEKLRAIVRGLNDGFLGKMGGAKWV